MKSRGRDRVHKLDKDGEYMELTGHVAIKFHPNSLLGM